MLKITLSYFVVTTIFLAHANSSDEMSNELFKKAVAAQGQQYQTVRQQIMSTKDARTFLTDVVNDSERSVDERWLAEILLARVTDPDEFERLESVFYKKCLRWIWVSGGRSISAQDFISFPEVCIDKRSLGIETALGRRATDLEMLRGYGEDYGDQEPVITVPSFEDLEAQRCDKADFEKWNQYTDAKLLPESKLWSLVAGELLLKGGSFAADSNPVPVFKDELRPNAFDEALTNGFDNRALISNDVDDKALISMANKADVLSRSAISVLTVLGDSKARHTMENLVREASGSNDAKTSKSTLYLVIESLGVIGNEETITVLESVALDPDLGYPAIAAITEIGGPTSKIALERASAKRREVYAKKREAAAKEWAQKGDPFGPPETRPNANPPGAVDDPFGD